MKILLVDDDIDFRESISEQLEMLNNQVIAVEGANKAFEVLENENFDVIITDVLMPKIDGMAFLKSYREKYGSETPVVIMSGGNSYIKEDFYTAGASEYFEKPVNIEEVLKKIAIFV